MGKNIYSSNTQGTRDIYYDYNNPDRLLYVQSILEKKYAIRRWYRKIYKIYTETFNNIKFDGIAIELGSGASFAKEFIPELITSDIIKYKGLDLIADGEHFPLSDNSVKFVCLCHVFHHIPNIPKFFDELQRCLMLGGKVLIVDQHRGLISTIILKYFHNEGWDASAPRWSFRSSGPLSGANGALSWIVFRRDIKIFTEKYPDLQILRYEPIDPLYYWLAGGLRRWSLLPKLLCPLAEVIDRSLIRISENLGSMNIIEIEKKYQ